MPTREFNNIEGLLLLDKAAGDSSNKALQQVKALFGVKKAGHTGTLDPFASGLLPICLGQATKFSHFLLASKKSYLVTMQLGATSTTGDVEGEITATDIKQLPTDDTINTVLKSFHGEIEQIPPQFSAIKVQGQRAYKLARQGITVSMPSRRVTIDKIVLQQCNGALVELAVECSKGTYIRTLVADIGKRLHCGAYATALRRLSVGSLPTTQLTFSQLERIKQEQGLSGLQRYILPITAMLIDLSEVIVSEQQARDLFHGKIIQHGEQYTEPKLVKVSSDKWGFMGIAQASAGMLRPKRLLSAPIE